LAAFNDAHDGHASTKFAGLRRHAHRANVGSLESLQNFRRGNSHGARAKIFEEQTGVLRVALFDGGGYAGGDRAASFVGDERDMLAGTDAEASLHGILGAGH
jgi:hypothetical protein